MSKLIYSSLHSFFCLFIKPKLCENPGQVCQAGRRAILYT